MVDRYKQPVQYRREFAQSRAGRAHSLLGVYMYAIQHIRKEENVLISGTRKEI
jgi:hypothetical protein